MSHQSFLTIFRKEGLPLGRKQAKRYLGFFFKLFLIIAIVNAIPDGVNFLMGWPKETTNVATYIVAVISLLFTFGLVKIYLHVTRGHQHALSDLRNHDRNRFFSWLGAKLLYSIIMIVLISVPMFILLFVFTPAGIEIVNAIVQTEKVWSFPTASVPLFIVMTIRLIAGIYIAARLYLYDFFAVDQKLNSFAALGRSRQVTQGHVWQIIGVWLLTVGVIMLGFIALIIGLLRAFPTAMIAHAKLYDRITGHDHHIE